MNHPVRVATIAMLAVSSLALSAGSAISSTRAPSDSRHAASAGINEPLTGPAAIDPAALTFMQGITTAQAMAQIASSVGLSPTPTITHSTLNGAVATYAGSTQMTLTADSKVTITKNAKGKVTGGKAALGFGETMNAKTTSLVDPVANYMAATGGSRAEAEKFFGGDPLAMYGAMLPDGRTIAPTTAAPATTQSHGALFSSGCADFPATAWYHDHGCYIAYVDSGSFSSDAPMLIDEEFRSTFYVDGWWRYPTYSDLWMAHQPAPVNFIPDWSPQGTQQSGVRCGTANIGLDIGFSTGYSWAICDGNIGPNGPLVYRPRPAPWPAGWTFGPLWRANGLSVSGFRYSLAGVGLQHTDRNHVYGRTFMINLQWAG